MFTRTKEVSSRGISGAPAWHNGGAGAAYQGRSRGITRAHVWHIRGSAWHSGGGNRGISGAVRVA